MRPRSHWDDRERERESRRRWEEPLPPSWVPQPVVVPRPTFLESIRKTLIGCLILLIVLLVLSILFVIELIPKFSEKVAEFTNNANPEKIFGDVGIPYSWVKLWIVCIFLGLAIGTVIRILRKI